MMKIFADTSFLCALYREQDNSLAADLLEDELEVPITISELVAFEVRQSARLQNYNFDRDRTKGYSVREGQLLIERMESNLRKGALIIEAADWDKVHKFAELLSEQYTTAGGHRTMDILHVATALHVKATHLYTFDDNQARLAKKAGLKTNLK